MATWKLSDLSKKMKDLDICMLSTISEDGINSRPMSNNGEVEYNGNSYFFSDEKSAVVQEIEDDPTTSLSFMGQNKLYITVVGESEVIRDKAEMGEHWTEDLEKWFPDGLETEGIVLIHAKATLIRYWEGKEQGEIEVDD